MCTDDSRLFDRITKMTDSTELNKKITSCPIYKSFKTAFGTIYALIITFWHLLTSNTQLPHFIRSISIFRTNITEIG